MIVLCCGCAVLACLRAGCPGALKWGSLAVSALLFLILLLALLLECVLGTFGNTTVLEMVTSPGETYIAAVVEYDQGALGGGTQVVAWRNREPVAVLIGQFSNRSACLCQGAWQETFRLRWKNDKTLLVNDEAFDLSNI